MGIPLQWGNVAFQTVKFPSSTGVSPPAVTRLQKTPACEL